MNTFVDKEIDGLYTKVYLIYLSPYLKICYICTSAAPYAHTLVEMNKICYTSMEELDKITWQYIWILF